MSVVLDVLSVALLGIGVAFLLGGTVGLVRFPDVYTRAHAASKCDSAGAGSVLLALALHGGLAFGDLKLVLLMLLVTTTGPTIAHALARASHRTGLPPWSAPDRGAR